MTQWKDRTNTKYQLNSCHHPSLYNMCHACGCELDAHSCVEGREASEECHLDWPSLIEMRTCDLTSTEFYFSFFASVSPVFIGFHFSILSTQFNRLEWFSQISLLCDRPNNCQRYLSWFYIKPYLETMIFLINNTLNDCTI